MIDHPTFKLNMTSDSVVFIVNHTRRDYIHANKIIGIDDLGLIVQKYLQDATLTFARRDGMYRIIKIGKRTSKKAWEAIEEVDRQPYLDKHYAGSFDEVVNNVKTDGKKTG